MADQALQAAYRTLLSYRTEIATQWTRELRFTSFSTVSTEQLRQELGELYALFCDVLCGERFNPTPLSAIGIVLVRHYFRQPESLASTLKWLTFPINRCPPETLPLLAERLPLALAHLVLVFNKIAYRHILREQEEVSWAVFESFRQLEMALRESEERYRQVVRWLPDSVTIHIDGRIVFANAKSAELLGFEDAEALIGKSVWDFIHPEDRAKVAAELGQIHVQGVTIPVEVRVVRPDGRIIWMEGRSTLIPYLNQNAILSVGRDVTDRKLAEEQLQEARRRLAHAREAERLRLAQDLHDGAIQHLLGISFRMARLQRYLQQQEESEERTYLETELRRLRRGVLETVRQLRQVVAELRPAGLEELGLAAAIENFVIGLQEETESPAIRFQVKGTDAHVPQNVALGLFRIVQEAVKNAVKHANARHIDVILDITGCVVTLSVCDDGAGFTMPSSLSAFALDNHFGLLGIVERVSDLGGTYTFDTAPGKGTRITVTVPLKEEDRDISYSRSAG